MKKPVTVSALTDFGRIRLSKSFFMRDFLFSDIASIQGFNNVPDNPELAIEAGTRLCEELLEPLQDTFGRIAIRSAYRSKEVNKFGNDNKLGCAANEKNFAGHIWDEPDARGIGAMACIVVPSFLDSFKTEGDTKTYSNWQKLAWWIHDHLPYSSLEFFAKNWAFNIQWHEKPVRKIDHFIPKGCLTRPGMENHDGSHESAWSGIVEACNGTGPALWSWRFI